MFPANYSVITALENERQRMVSEHQIILNRIDHLIEQMREDEHKETPLSILERYASPSNETSLAKGIPMKYLSLIQESFRGRFVYRYRGKSTKDYKRPSQHIKKAYAETFALYETK